MTDSELLKHVFDQEIGFNIPDVAFCGFDDSPNIMNDTSS